MATPVLNLNLLIKRQHLKQFKNQIQKRLLVQTRCLLNSLFKAGVNALPGPFTSIFNLCAENNKFPDDLKRAQVTPVYQNEGPFIKKNYLPVSILTPHSKVFETLICEQLFEHCDKNFIFLTTFRKGFRCQTTLLRLEEDWKKALDRQHDLIVVKKKANGLSTDACNFRNNYLSNRKQGVKIGKKKYSIQLNILKDVPHGSILGPLLFNIFINGISFFVRLSSICNYADDNTLSYSH